MSSVLLSRWQFGITTIYHFLFVPLTIGLAFLLAVMQTIYYRTGNPQYRRMTKFWGRLFLINFALGVVTGIVQEFQFGMNWSTYSRFVGDIFGAPLAIEGLLAFFLESVFIGLWIFGWDRLSPKVHLFSIWMVALGTSISAFWILAAGSFMQNPVGYTLNSVTGRAELDNFGAVLTNVSLWAHFPHTLSASLATSAALLVAVSAWHLLRNRDEDFFVTSARFGMTFLLIGALAVAFTGHSMGQVMTDVQPMKMASAEALWETEQPAGFSLFAIGDIRNGRNHINIQVPKLLSLFSANNFSAEVKGINPLQAEMEAKYGPGNYIPNVGLIYWTFRIMVGAGFAMIGLALYGLYLIRKKKLMKFAWYHKVALWALALPFIANATGWVMTEMGRQPFVVYGLLKTDDAASVAVSSGEVLTTLIGFTLLYGVLAFVDFYLMAKYAKAGPDPDMDEAQIAASMAY